MWCYEGMCVCACVCVCVCESGTLLCREVSVNKEINHYFPVDIDIVYFGCETRRYREIPTCEYNVGVGSYLTAIVNVTILKAITRAGK